MYIITLKPGVDMERHFSSVRGIHEQPLNKRMDNKADNGVLFRYKFSGFHGYAGHFDETVIDELMASKDVEDIEADQIWTTQSIMSQKNPPPGLKMISWRGWALVKGNVYRYHSSAGKGTFAYVIDSGIDVLHREFEGRAANGWSVMGNSSFEDKDGHGTYVAGIIGSKTFGVAKKCDLISVKISEGHTTSASVFLAGFNWAVNDILAKGRTRKAIINVSTSGPRSKPVNKAVDSAFKVGVALITTAGNEGRFVAKRSPGSATSSITVAATDKWKKRASWSNAGPGTTLFAPGVDIPSTWIGLNHDFTRTMSGTSAAAPHVAGLAVYFQGMYNYDSKGVKAAILRYATKNLVLDTKGAPNLFAYNDNDPATLLANL
ncbi:oryzin precursor [Myriangium duriaei CBS 260.36]|uniref:Oryzin n=1 Tax=Myriangium duriaei CBS 260.36 TaxID=1168546 RepID=A0A9P4J2E5_9PEZI|nr:oryzin precursor [Myriangium duriaei CBS 260.36]